MSQETSPPMTDNQALNAMVTELEELTDFLEGRYSLVRGDGVFVLLTSAAPRIRGAEATAVKTVVTNKGPNQVEVRENGVVVLIVPANNTVEQGTLPLAGAGPLRFTVAAGQTANLAVATYRRA